MRKWIARTSSNRQIHRRAAWSFGRILPSPTNRCIPATTRKLSASLWLPNEKHFTTENTERTEKDKKDNKDQKYEKSLPTSMKSLLSFLSFSVLSVVESFLRQ